MKNLHFLLIYIFLISNIFEAKSQTWNHYTPFNSGLVNHTVNIIYIDTFGVKWFGTPGGVSKFDGTNWTNYTTTNGLINNDVREIYRDHYGNMWFGTLGGISRFDGTNWTNFTKQSNNLPSNNIRAIIEDKYGEIYCGGYDEGGLKKYNGLFWESTAYYTCPKVCKLLLDNQQNLNIGGYTASSVQINNSWQLLIYTNFGLRTMAIDKNNKRYFLTENPPLKILSGNTITDVTLPANAIANAVCFDDNGLVWYGTSNYIMKYNAGVYTIYDSTSGITNPIIYTIVCEGNSKIWAGGNGGVYELVCNSSSPILINPITTSNGDSVTQGQSGIIYQTQAIANADFYKWQYSGSGVTINGNSNIITIDFSDSATSGILKVQAVDSCGNNSPVEILPIVVQAPIGIYDPGEKVLFKIFPNPVNDKLIITSESNELSTIKISDLSGKVLILKNINSDGMIKIDVSSLSSGQYFIQFTNNLSSQTQKFIKK